MRLAVARARRAVASALERGTGGPAALGTAWTWASERGPALVAPPRTLLVPIRGATLGGSWKTPTAIALARELSARGEGVALAVRSYGGSLIGPRRVHAGDDVRCVGDEALLAARCLGSSIQIVAGRRRDEVVGHLAGAADVIVLDGHHRAGPGHAVILALDADHPFGAGALPPRGDLRAAPDDLLRDARWVVVVRDVLAEDTHARPSALTATYDLVLPADLRGARAALVTAVARPSRVVAALARRGVSLAGHVELADHGGPWATAAAERGLARLSSFDVVLTTEKCATWLPSRLAGRPVAPLALRLELPTSLVDDVVATARAVRRDPSLALLSPNALR